MKFAMRALAVLFIVIAHAFLLNLGRVGSTALGFAYVGSVIGLWVGAGLLWRRTMQ